MSEHAIRSILIVGGGTAGWMAANLLAVRLKGLPIAITLVESPEIGTVGVGEATVPAIRDYLRAIDADIFDVMHQTQGTVKLGIEFRDWSGRGESFFHPFGRYGADAFGVPFHQYWLKRRAAGDRTPLAHYCLPTRLAMAGQVLLPAEPVPNDLGNFDWAIHFDAGLFAAYLSRRARDELNVRHVQGKVRDVTLHPESGDITHVVLEDEQVLEADLFVDCSGFRSLLLGSALGVPFEDWGDLLPCNRAVAMACVHGDAITPYTRATARTAGWQWRIPLQHRVGNGYVYDGSLISDDEATAVLLGSLEGEALSQPNLLRFRAGHRVRIWERNCVGIGLAAGFLEPLESTSITLIQSGIERLLNHFPDRGFAPALAAEFNRITTLEYARIRDFLLLHYWANRRDGETLWDRARGLDLPDTLQARIAAFTQAGKLPRLEWDTFQPPSWLSMFAGFDLLPVRHDPLADRMADTDLATAFTRMDEALTQASAAAPSHADFLTGTGAATAAPSPVHRPQQVAQEQT
ncbi:tryptophan halogenase family protein [Novosphingobium sp. 9]|uniref:tryptophan halogenase family protein n=1 Tax=Novosphingobium sp. 9 TaxID=2025349 RepID=UPI0021B5FF28|nr:tryptophan halogenase family protein [Novosphingobium sp. 9]